MRLGQIFLSIVAAFSSAPGVAERSIPPASAVDILSHKLEITPDFQSQSLSGSAHIRFRTRQDKVHRIAFSRNDLVVDAAHLNGQPVTVSLEAESTIFSSSSALRRGQVETLTISYHGKPARGLTFTEKSVFTSYFACDWMFCNQDAPADKAAIEIRLIVPAGMKTLSVGMLKSTSTDNAGRSVHLWRGTRPYSSYLYGFAAGRFTETVSRQRSYELVYLDATPSTPNMDALFGTTATMVSFLENKSGIRLPTRRYAQLLVPGSEAQEAATYSIIGLRQIEPILQQAENDWVIIHELAHQWWGNLITCQSWDHFWLNEGIVVFMTAAWKEHRFGKAAYEAELDLARARLARAREAGFDKPLAFPGPYPNLGLRRAVQYSKGALFMDHLRQLLGDQLFWSALRYYTQEHSGGTVESRDLQRAFEKISGRDLSTPFNAWVYG